MTNTAITKNTHYGRYAARGNTSIFRWVRSVFVLFLSMCASIVGAQEGIFHDPLNSGPSAPFVVIWQIGANRGETYHSTTITPLFDYVRLVNSPPLVGSAGNFGSPLFYNCPTATNQFVFNLHPQHSATFIVGGTSEQTTLSYGWPTAARHANHGGGVVPEGYYNLKFQRFHHDGSPGPTTFEFNAWITGGTWHTNAPEREVLEGQVYEDPVITQQGMSRVIVRVMMAGVERIIQARIVGPANGSAPTPANFAPVGLGDYTVSVNGQVNGITLTGSTDIKISFPQSRLVTFYFDSEGNLTSVGGSGGGSGGTEFPNSTWWGDLFESLFVPSTQSLEDFSETWESFWDWGPFDLYGDLQDLFDDGNTDPNTGILWFGNDANGFPLVRLPMHVYDGNGNPVGDPNAVRYLDFTGGTLGNGGDNTDGAGNIWNDYLRPAMGLLVYAGFAFAMVQKFMPRHTV